MSAVRETAPLTRRKMTDKEVLRLKTAYYPFIGPQQSFEATVFGLLGEWCPEYSGGLWTYYVLSNGAWYLAPNGSEAYGLKDIDGQVHTMSSDGAGLTATLYLVNHLSWMFHDTGEPVKSQAATDHYHALRMFTYPHADARAIWKVLD